MLILLDNAQIWALTKARVREREKFDAFLSLWTQHGCELALTRANLQEIVQGDDSTAQRDQAWTLREFPIVRFNNAEPDWISALELSAQIQHRLDTISALEISPYASIRQTLFSETVVQQVLAYMWDLREASRFDKRHRDRHADFENGEMGFSQLFKKMAGRAKPKYPLDIEIHPFILQKVLELTPPGEHRSRVLKTLKRMEICGPKAKSERQMLICVHELERLKILKVRDVPTADMGILGFLRHHLGEQRVLPYLTQEGIPEDAVRAHFDDMDPYALPGTSLRMAVERGRKLATKQSEAGDFLDADFVMAAAHVDLAFVDQRTAGYLRQEKNKPRPLISPFANTRIFQHVDLDSTMKQIAKSAAEAGD